MLLAKLFSYGWTLGLCMCKLLHYIQSVSDIYSVLTLTAMSAGRLVYLLIRGLILLQLAKLFSYGWTLGLCMCKLLHYMQSVSAICSVLTLTAISAERLVYLLIGGLILLQLAKLFSYGWTLGLCMCKLLHYMQSVSAICSVLTLTAMSVESRETDLKGRYGLWFLRTNRRRGIKSYDCLLTAD
ncbi:hypothetical protein J6590_070238 [Homalodisca vitripennis]|nr:hypothetical protein J6590_070238 [Homalodisca vitripennis]